MEAALANGTSEKGSFVAQGKNPAQDERERKVFNHAPGISATLAGIIVASLLAVMIVFFTSLEGRISETNVRIDDLSTKMDHRFDQVNARFDAVNARLDRVIEMLAKR